MNNYFKRLRVLIIFLAVEISLLSLRCDNTNPVYGQSPARVGISGDSFAINGSPKFLLGVSYFDGRGWKESDLTNLSSRGFNLIRIWLFWRSTFPASHYFDANADWQNGADNDLLELVDFAGNIGIIVDVTILQSTLPFSEPAKRLKAVQNVTTLLTDRDNVFFDISNEHDHSGNSTIDHNEVLDLINVVKAIDPDRIVTVSSQGDHILPGGNSGVLHQSNVHDEVNAGVDVFTPHFLRISDWAEKTGQRVTIVKDYLKSIGENIPVYLQEENRRGLDPNSDPDANQFFKAAEDAHEAGAAGWIFHTSAGYRLLENNSTFFDSLDPVERTVVNELPNRILNNTDTTPPTSPINVKVTVPR